MKKIAVLMMAYGGPNSLAEIEPYLLDIRGGRHTPEALIKEIQERYAAIGGRSPLLEITNRQAKALESYLNNQIESKTEKKLYEVWVGMRHWHPYIKDVVKKIYQQPPEKIVAFCMTPYASKLSTQAYFNHLDLALKEITEFNNYAVPVTRISSWHNHPLFIRAVKEKIDQALLKFPEAGGSEGMILFSAHSLPAALIQQGDPYEQQIRTTVKLVVDQLGIGDHQWQFCFQSAGASNDRWLGPSIEETIHSLANSGVRSILSVPIGFVSDHVEVLYDIDIEIRELANVLGIRLERTDSLNDSLAFIQALASITLEGNHYQQ